MADEIYFFGSKLASMARSTSVIVEDTTASTFDSNFVANSIKVPGGGTFIEGAQFVDAASATTISVTFTFYATTSWVSGWMFLALVNAAGTVVARLLTSAAGTIKFQYWNGSTYVDLGSTSIILPLNSLTRFSLTLTCGAGGSFTLYSQGAVVASGTHNNANVNNVAKVQFYNPTSITNNYGYFSDFVCANFDTRDHHWKPRNLNSVGTYFDATGTYTDLIETPLDESTAIALAASGSKESYGHVAEALPVGYQIRHIGVAGRVRVSGGVITNGKYFLLSGGVKSDSSNLSPTAGYEPRLRYWVNDPNTLTSWTQSGWNSTELGLEAV